VRLEVADGDPEPEERSEPEPLAESDLLSELKETFDAREIEERT
jgi:hypothetical protein